MFGFTWGEIVQLVAMAGSSAGPSPVEQWKANRSTVVPDLQKALAFLKGSKAGNLLEQAIAADAQLFGPLTMQPVAAPAKPATAKTPAKKTDPPISIQQAARKITSGQMSAEEKRIFEAAERPFDQAKGNIG